MLNDAKQMNANAKKNYTDRGAVKKQVENDMADGWANCWHWLYYTNL